MVFKPAYPALRSEGKHNITCNHTTFTLMSWVWSSRKQDQGPSLRICVISETQVYILVKEICHCILLLHAYLRLCCLFYAH